MRSFNLSVLESEYLNGWTQCPMRYRFYHYCAQHTSIAQIHLACDIIKIHVIIIMIMMIMMMMMTIITVYFPQITHVISITHSTRVKRLWSITKLATTWNNLVLPRNEKISIFVVLQYYPIKYSQGFVLICSFCCNDYSSDSYVTYLHLSFKEASLALG